MILDNSKSIIKSLVENLTEEKRIEFLSQFFNKRLDEDAEDDEEHASQKTESLSREEALEQLRNSYSSYNNSHKFVVGQYLRWKAGMKNRYKPDYNMPVVVMELLDKAIVSEEEEIYSPYFREKIDIVIGLIDDDNEFVFIHCDKSRFEPFE